MIVVSSKAVTDTPGTPAAAAFCALTVAPRPTDASVVSSRILIVGETATAT